MKAFRRKKNSIKPRVCLQAIEKQLILEDIHCRGFAKFKPVKILNDPRISIQPRNYMVYIMPKDPVKRACLLVGADELATQNKPLATMNLILRMIKDYDECHRNWNCCKVSAERGNVWCAGLTESGK